MPIPDRHLTPPASLNPGFPFQVSATINRENSRITLTIETPEGWARALLDALEILTALGDLIRRRFDHARMLVKANATLAAVEAENRLIAQAYRDARKTGKLHRAAIAAVFDDPRFDHLKERGWTKTDFGRVVRDHIGGSDHGNPNGQS